jgi:beta-galactosidase/beta-glucuronidase
MKLRTLAVAVLALFCTLGAVAQDHHWNNTQVELTSQNVGRAAEFYVNSHNLGEDICIVFTLDPSSYNVEGNFAGRYTLYASSGERNIYVGRYWAVTNAAWNVYVTFTYTRGACN